MSTELFIARKITQSDDEGKSVARPIVKIAVFGISLGLAVMIVSMAVITGFKEVITGKVSGFGGHIIVSNFDSNRSFETVPIPRNQIDVAKLKQIDGIKHAQIYITKSGIIKTNDNIQAIILKGIDKDFSWDFFSKNLVDGTTFTLSDSVKSDQTLISETISRMLGIKTGDKISVYFVQDPPRVRRFTISGIYKTSIEDFDKTFMMVDYRHLQKLNGWDSTMVSGYEILIDNFDQLEPMTEAVFDVAGNRYSEEATLLKIENIRQKYTQIFSWLDLMDINVVVIIALMLVVAGINMITGLLILILEKIPLIGLLKAVGYNNWQIRKIFLFQSGFLIGKGLLWGNLIGFAICAIQWYFHLIPLEESTYYINTVPISIKWWHIVSLNAGTMIVVLVMLILPSLLISTIKPAKAIKFN